MRYYRDRYLEYEKISKNHFGVLFLKVYIREGKLQDYIEIALLNKNELGYDYNVEDTKKQLEKLIKKIDHKIFVAIASEKIIGYIHATSYDLLYAPHLKDIIGIAVSSNFRKLGIGKMLIYEVEKLGKETGAYGIRLVSGAERKEAHIFYKSCGYSESKDQKNFKKIL